MKEADTKAAGQPEMGTQRRGGRGGAEGGTGRGGEGEPPEGGTTERGA
jgi:hypothetical protein